MLSLWLAELERLRQSASKIDSCLELYHHRRACRKIERESEGVRGSENEGMEHMDEGQGRRLRQAPRTFVRYPEISAFSNFNIVSKIQNELLLLLLGPQFGAEVLH